jgi:hypothetical protein
MLPIEFALSPLTIPKSSFTDNSDYQLHWDHGSLRLRLTPRYIVQLHVDDMTRRLKARIAQPEETAISRQLLCKHVSTATKSRDRSNRHKGNNMEKCWKRRFLCSPCRHYARKTYWTGVLDTGVEAGSNTSTVTLRVRRRRKGKSQI